MRRQHLLPLAIAASAFFNASAFAQSVTTDPVGFTTTTCLANSDTYVGVPFTRPPDFVGAIQGVSGNTITVSGNPWTANQFVGGAQPKFFVLIGPHSSTNPKEGNNYSITGNGTNTLTLDLEGESIAAVQPQTQILVIAYPTLISVFPAADANVSFVPSASAFNRQTEILVPNYGGTGVNLSSAATYFFFNGAWRKFGQPNTTSFNDDPFVNSGYFVVRNKGTQSKLTTLGSVLTKKATVPLLTRQAGSQDNFVSLIRPVDVKLNDLGLITSGAFTTSPSQFNRVDELFVFNNAAAQVNKSASATYYYRNNAWRKFGADANADFGNDTIPTGAGFIIRKGATVDGATKFWQNSPTY